MRPFPEAGQTDGHPDERAPQGRTGTRADTPGERFATNEMPPDRLTIPIGIYDAMIAHLQASLPWEGCGLLAAVREDDASARAVDYFPGTNIDRSVIRYTMDPAEVVAAFRTMRERGWVLGAIVHSHPISEAVPSETDLAEAYYPEALMVIVSFSREPLDIGVWAVVDEENPRFARREMAVVPASGRAR